MSSRSAADLAHTAHPTGTWTVVPDACTVSFSVRDKLFGTVHGAFPVTAGTVVTDASGTVVRARMELDVAGVRTGNAHRDRDVQKPRILDATGHPTIVVETGPTKPRESGWTVAAQLSARGACCALELHVTATILNEQQVRVHVTGRLDRAGLGMRVPTFIIGRHLDIDVDTLFERV